MSGTDTLSLVERVTALDAEFTAAETLVVAYLAATDGARTRGEINGATRISSSAALPYLCDIDVCDRRERETDNGGRNPYVYDLTAETRAALDTETPEWGHDALETRIIRELAEIHYERGLSSATAKRLARDIPGASSRYVAGRLRSLADGDGPIECVKRETPANYRLVGAGLFTPYRALADPERATDGGTDQ